MTMRLYIVYVDKATPRSTGRIGAERIRRSREETLDVIPCTVIKHLTIAADNRREAIRRSGFAKEKRS